MAPQSDPYENAQIASTELLVAVSAKRIVCIAEPGSDDWRYLDLYGLQGASSSYSITLRPNPYRITVWEEFLHGTQDKLGVTNRMLDNWGLNQGRIAIERHVKEFMCRHASMLDLSEADVAVLRALIARGL